MQEQNDYPQKKKFSYQKVLEQRVYSLLFDITEFHGSRDTNNNICIFVFM